MKSLALLSTERRDNNGILAEFKLVTLVLNVRSHTHTLHLNLYIDIYICQNTGFSKLDLFACYMSTCADYEQFRKYLLFVRPIVSPIVDFVYFFPTKIWSLHWLAHPEFIHWAQSIVRVKCWILQEEDKRINVRKNAKIGNTKNKIFITWCIADNLLFQMAMRLLHWRVFQLVQHSKYINTHAHRYN